jgi:nucleoside-diphosphate-sugar epimerase
MQTSSRDAALRIAVLGAGYVGGALAQAAHTAGHAVWAVRRSATNAPSTGVQWRSGDLAAGMLAGVPEALDAVVLTIAPGEGRTYADTYAPAARAAVALSRAAGARTLLYTSSTGVYGGEDGAWVTESSPRLGTGDGNDALISAEDVVLESGLSGAQVLRVAGIYGPGRDPRTRLRAPAVLPQRGAYWMNLAHRDDIVGAVLHLLRHPSGHSVLNVCDGAPALAAEVLQWVASAEGRDVPNLAFTNDAPLRRSNQRVSNAHLRSTGWSPRYPDYRDGFTHGL